MPDSKSSIAWGTGVPGDEQPDRLTVPDGFNAWVTGAVDGKLVTSKAFTIRRGESYVIDRIDLDGGEVIGHIEEART